MRFPSVEEGLGPGWEDGDECVRSGGDTQLVGERYGSEVIGVDGDECRWHA